MIWYDPKIDTSEFRALLSKARRIACREAGWNHQVVAIIEAIDNYAHVATGNREYFWDKPVSVG